MREKSKRFFLSFREVDDFQKITDNVKDILDKKDNQAILNREKSRFDNDK